MEAVSFPTNPSVGPTDSVVEPQVNHSKNWKVTHTSTYKITLKMGPESVSAGKTLKMSNPPSSALDSETLLKKDYGLKECSILIDKIPRKQLNILRKIAEVKKVLDNLTKRQLPKFKRLELDTQKGNIDPCETDKEILCHVENCGFKGKFTSRFELDMHLKRHHQGVKKPYICQLCSKSFQTQRYLEDHMNGHNGEKPYMCNTCGIRRGTKSLLNRHQRLVHGAQTRKRTFRCKVCRARFDSRRKCLDHEIIHPELHHQNRKQEKKGERGNNDKKDRSIRTIYECTLCGFKGKFHSIYKQHMMRHSDFRPVQCDICKRAFKRRSALTVHMAVHTEERPFSCGVCSKRFKLKKTLANHILLHSGSRPYNCHICPKTYPTSTHLTMHMLSHKKKGDFVRPSPTKSGALPCQHQRPLSPPASPPRLRVQTPEPEPDPNPVPVPVPTPSPVQPSPFLPLLPPFHSSYFPQTQQNQVSSTVDLSQLYTPTHAPSYTASIPSMNNLS